jgi:glycerol-3-phosphate dehydrogenase
MTRDKLIADLQQNKDITWDVIIIGGGATGLGIALDAVLRGYKTLLLEQSDFAAGTSSRSTKLVHGGVRYMAQGDLLLVIEALKERGLILRNAPHLTGNQEFIIPIYSVWDAILYTVGLKFYDLLAGRLSLGKSYFIRKKTTLERLPLLKQEGLIGGVVYHDGQFDDSRLAISIAKAAVKKGAIILNYFRVINLIKNENGKITGAEAKDLLSGTEYNLKSGLVINATGVFADTIHRMDDPSSQPTLRPSQGVHIVIDKSFLQGNSAIMIPKTDDGRVLFAIPWYGKVVVGTTDTPLNNISMEPKALEEEIRFILSNAGKYLTKPPLREDVLSIYAGLRPLAASRGNKSSTKGVSRRHRITLSPSGLLTIIGGKWTTYRCMAEETIDKALRAGMLNKRECVTKNFSLADGDFKDGSDRMKIYGDGANEIRKMISNDHDLATPINSSLPYTKAEILWIIRDEMPCTLTDVLARRTRSLFLDARASLEAAPLVADILAGELSQDTAWKENQVKEYNQLVLNYL